MLLRSDILAAFIALVVSVLICAWAAVLFAWQLSGAMFLLPLAVALMLATWLRAPDWIAERNSWRAWLKPVLPVAATLVGIGVALPYARLAQIDNQPTPTTKLYGSSAQSPIDVDPYVAAHRARATPEARETAAMYLRALDVLYAWEADDPLEPWRKPEIAQNSSAGATGIDEAKIPPDQQEAFLQAKERWSVLVSESRAAAVKLAIEASSRPTCYFVDVNYFAGVQIASDRRPSLDTYRLYRNLNQLLAALWLGPPDAPFEQLLAAMRMSAHISAGQPSVVYLDQLAQEKAILAQIGIWGGGDSRTSEELKSAVDQLTAYFRAQPWLPEVLIADHVQVVDVLRGRSPSLVLAQKHQSSLVHLAYLANQLPWEQQRAELALIEITRHNIEDANLLSSQLMNVEPGESGNVALRRWLRPMYRDGWTESWVRAQPAAATSYLARLEYQARAPVHEIYRAYCFNQTYRRAALLKIALAMYRRDHGVYPARLTELVPDYLLWTPIDPFSGQQFVYRAAGLELPLQGRSFSNYQRIDANTPLFWSVGAGNARLKQSSRTVFVDDEDAPQADSRFTTETVYVLQSDEPLWMSEPACAFPLPRTD